MKDVMVDIETWGRSEHAVIVQVGACFFDRYTGEIGRTLLMNIDAEDSMAFGFEVDASTIYWWLQQEDAARQSILDRSNANNASIGIHQLNQFLAPAECFWSHATFDFVIISAHLKKLNQTPTFSYRSARDIRTLVDLAGIDPKTFPPIGTAHNALDDCLFQVSYCSEAFRILRDRGINLA